jgi:hypothetical protein
MKKKRLLWMQPRETCEEECRRQLAAVAQKMWHLWKPSRLIQTEAPASLLFLASAACL